MGKRNVYFARPGARKVHLDVLFAISNISKPSEAAEMVSRPDIASEAGPYETVPHLDGDGAAAFNHACRMGLKGIVAKRRDKPYRSGRSPDWIKVKNPHAPAASRIMEW
jgi:hypothetical protein